MKKVINESDIKKANNIERCRMLIAIIKGEAVYVKEVRKWKMKLEKLFIKF